VGAIVTTAPLKIGVITCSNRSVSGVRTDESGQLLADGLSDAGHDVISRVVVADDVDAIQSAVAAAVASGADAVITTGGTGLTPTDVTPEAVRPLLDREIPGISEALRMASREQVPTSVLSRGVAGAIGAVLVVTLPGSPGGVRDGLKVLLPIVEHAVAQLRGGDHQTGGGV
jgi:molybdenum cofactor synthesis domain-containing protein